MAKPYDYKVSEKGRDRDKKILCNGIGYRVNAKCSLFSQVQSSSSASHHYQITPLQDLKDRLHYRET